MGKKHYNYKYLKTSWRYQVREYFDNSSLHGVPYIAEKGRPFREKFLWFCVTAAGAVTTMVIISSLWEKFQTNPTITSLDTDFHSWDVKFPTVTICDRTPANPELIDMLLDSQGINETSDQYDYLKSFYNTIVSLSYASIEDIKNFTHDKSLPQNDYQKLIFDIALHCEDLMFDCVLLGLPTTCCQWPIGFLPIFTENGFCYIFNSPHSLRKWPWQNGTISENEKFELQYVKETDEKWSLKLYNQHMNPSSLVEVYIHTEDDIPGVDMLPHLEWTGTVYKISFSVKQTYTTEDGRQLSIKQRRCAFEDEIKLKTNTVYTFYSCTRQCRIEAARKLCGCVPHFYPQFDDVKYCNLKELGCIADHKNEIIHPKKCTCELGCSNTVLEVDKLLEVDALQPSATRNDTYRDLEIEFVSLPMVRYKREVIFGWVDLLVAFGGIAGLFLGFSLLSGVEIIYYFTIRALCMVYRDKDELRKFERENERKQIIPNYDLSLTPYFLKPPEPGNGIKVLQRQQGFYTHNWNQVKPVNNYRSIKPPPYRKEKIAWEDRQPPFGIEFVH